MLLTLFLFNIINCSRFSFPSLFFAMHVLNIDYFNVVVIYFQNNKSLTPLAVCWVKSKFVHKRVQIVFLAYFSVCLISFDVWWSLFLSLSLFDVDSWLNGEVIGKWRGYVRNVVQFRTKGKEGWLIHYVTQFYYIFLACTMFALEKCAFVSSNYPHTRLFYKNSWILVNEWMWVCRYRT